MGHAPLAMPPSSELLSLGTVMTGSSDNSPRTRHPRSARITDPSEAGKDPPETPWPSSRDPHGFQSSGRAPHGRSAQLLWQVGHQKRLRAARPAVRTGDAQMWQGLSARR